MFICHVPDTHQAGVQERIWMPVSYKVAIPETGDVHCFDAHQYAKAVEKWHEEITWLDCDTYLLRVNTTGEAEDEQIVLWYLREYPAFSCPPNCSWCTKFQIARSRYLGVSPVRAEEEAKHRLQEWRPDRFVSAEGSSEITATNLEQAA
jgi:hypothetical protein